MVNFKLGVEIRKDGIFICRERGTKKKSESPTGIERMTFVTVKWLLLSGKMFVRLSLVFIPSPDVTQLVLLLTRQTPRPKDCQVRQ